MDTTAALRTTSLVRSRQGKANSDGQRRLRTTRSMSERSTLSEKGAKSDFSLES